MRKEARHFSFSHSAKRLIFMPLTTRAALAGDEQQAVVLWHACDLVTSYNDPGADFRFAVAGISSDVLVGENEEGRVCATVMVGHDGHRGWVYYVATDPTVQGSGYGRQMVEAGEAWLRDRGVVKVQLLVRETNKRVVAFYEHIGFEIAPRTVMAKWIDEPPK
jgi:ribosomal protein S18 acetylase RimI-like enzyme